MEAQQAAKVENLAQSLTKEQQSRSFITVVASNFTMADGYKQNPSKAMVRMRDGSMKYVKDLAQIDRSNPQPNGDYCLPMVNDHDGDVKSQSGAMWVWVENSLLYALAVFSDNNAAENLIPLARDGFLQFSTEGYVEDFSEEGEYGDFWITAIAPVTVGNDPSTQIIMANVMNALKDRYKGVQSIVDTVLNKLNEAENKEESELEEMETITNEVQAIPEAAPSVENTIMANEVKGRDWLKTDNAMSAFVDALKLGDARSTKHAWEDTLTKNAITFDPDEVAALPELLITEIDTVLTTNGEIYNRLNHTGLMWAVGASAAELESAKVRARGASTTKTSQTVAAEVRIIQPIAFYKFFSEAYDVIARNGGLNGAIATFAARELAMKVLELIERAVVVGGVTDDASQSISPTFVMPISADTVANGVYGGVYTPAAGESEPVALSSAAAQILSGGAVTLITTRARAARLPYLTVEGIPMFLNSAERGSVNIPMVDAVVAPVWLTEADLAGGVGYLVDLSAYKTVGETGTQAFYQFHLRTNEHDFEAIKMFGGALSKPMSAVKVMAVPAE